MSTIKQQTLERHADRIDAVLRQHRVAAQVVGGAVTPRLVQFELAARVGTKISKILTLSEEIAMALGVNAVRIQRREEHIVIEVRRTRAASVKLLPLCERLNGVPPATAILGVDDSGTPLLLRLPAPDVAHVLVAGTTGSGKTALLRSLLVSLALKNTPDTLQFVLVDPKGHNLLPLARLPHALGDDVATSPQEVLQRLRWLVQEMQRRDRSGANSPRIIVALDELADLMQTGGKAVEQLVTRLVQRGRQAGIHVVASTQKPTAGLVGSGVVANFPLRLVGMCSTKDEARYATGISGSGAERLAGKGDFLLVAKGECTRFQAGWIGPKEFRSVVERSVS